MRLPARRLTFILLVAGCPYDPETPEYDAITDSDTDASSGGSSDTDTPTTTPDTDTPTTSPDTTADTSETNSSGFCGDGMLDSGEVCDDGINDGSYGGCLADCGGAAPSCGDGEVNGPEVCDDGVNDGGYGGCTADCTALGPYCGDGTMQDPELCDEGEANANGTGCNVDCVTSGTVVGTYTLGGLSFCDGEFVTPPVFREDGNALISATGYCDDDSVVLVELSPTVELVQMFDDLLLPSTPVREATLAGDAWLLSASGCTYAISPAGELTEACEPGRIAGYYALDARDDGTYIALDYNALGSYPAGGPMAGVGPTWQAAPPAPGFYEFGFGAAAIGGANAALVGGYRRTVSDNTYVGYLARFTAAGNDAGDYTFASSQSVAAVAAGSDGSVAIAMGYPNYRVMRLDANFNESWGVDVPAGNDVHVAVDSTGAVVFAYYDTVSAMPVLRKWTADGAELWSIAAAAGPNDARIAIDANDNIWLAAANFVGLAVAKVSP